MSYELTMQMQKHFNYECNLVQNFSNERRHGHKLEDVKYGSMSLGCSYCSHESPRHLHEAKSCLNAFDLNEVPRSALTMST